MEGKSHDQTGAQNGHVSYVFSKYKCKQTLSVLVKWDLCSEDTLGTEANVSWIEVSPEWGVYLIINQQRHCICSQSLLHNEQGFNE